MSNIFKFRTSPSEPWQVLPVIKGQDGYTPQKGIDYFTEEDIQELIDMISLGEIDLSKYALKTDIPDTSGFLTEEEIIELINTALGVIENGTY